MKRSHQRLLDVHKGYPPEMLWDSRTDKLHQMLTGNVRIRHLHEAFIREDCMRSPHERLKDL